ncbi:MAG: HAD hydrolase family protein [Muribaculaceae bacterium]|nr:HAD hydrolase family protein [Muribaculaceae bacterium]MEE1298723.1 HAD hydrolase family protein [Muribaculaceae bacterium]
MSSINYDLSKIKGFAFDVDGVLSPSVIPLHPNGEPMRCVSVKDGYALQLAIKHGYQVAVITGGNTEAVRKRFVGLGVQTVILGADMKLQFFEEWLKNTGLKPEEVVYAGDDIPDYEAMQHAGLSVAPADAASEIKEIAKYISPLNGGQGVGREIIEQVMKAKGEWLADKNAFGW